jgi:hypothetical protein
MTTPIRERDVIGGHLVAVGLIKVLVPRVAAGLEGREAPEDETARTVLAVARSTLEAAPAEQVLECVLSLGRYGLVMVRLALFGHGEPDDGETAEWLRRRVEHLDQSAEVTSSERAAARIVQAHLVELSGGQVDREAIAALVRPEEPFQLAMDMAAFAAGVLLHAMGGEVETTLGAVDALWTQ